MKKKLKKAWAAIAAWLAAAIGCEEMIPAPRWDDCRRSSCWDANASRRMMNIVSPHFADEKARDYLDWQKGRGCDHIHVLLVNGGDGEGAGYDALANPDHKRLAMKRIREARKRGLGVVAWIVADDSETARREIFRDPGLYARSLADFHECLSYIVLGLEMDEGRGTLADWTALRDAVVAAGWRGRIATHHTSGRRTYAGLGQIVMDQLTPNCSTAAIAESVGKLRRQGFDVCGFEYSRNPDRVKAEAALAAGAFGVGNW